MKLNFFFRQAKASAKPNDFRLMSAALLLCLSALQAKADDFGLYLVSLDGEQYTSLNYATLQSLSFEQVREVNDAGDRVYVNRMTANHQDGNKQVFNLADYASIRFMEQSVGLSSLHTDADGRHGFRLQGRSLQLDHASTLHVYQTDGRQVLSRHMQAGQTIDLSSLSAGTYIIHVDGQSAKILVK